MFCVKCGRELEKGKKFCTSCGAPQSPESAGAAVSPAAPTAKPGGGPPGGRMSRGVIVALACVLALLLAGGVAAGLFFILRSSPPGKTARPAEKRKEKTATTRRSGQRLAYLDKGDIYTVSMSGTGAVKLTDRGDIVDFAVAPDGSRMAFVVDSGEQRIIFKMKADGGDVSQVTLPEKGLADNPAFDPDSRYIYFTRVAPFDQGQENQQHGVGFERYDIAANKVDHLYTLEGLYEQSVSGLWADPRGGALYYNLFGSDFPSSVPRKLTLGAAPSDSVYMPIQRDTGVYTAVACQLTDFSPDGKKVSYYKQMLFASSDPEAGPSMKVDACVRPVNGGGETAVAEYAPVDYRLGEVTGMEFSRGQGSRYFLSKVSSSSDTAMELQFYSGEDDGSLAAIPLRLSLTLQPERYSPVTWHLLPVK